MPKFNKRHYEAIATVMQNLHPGNNTDTIDYDARLEMWSDTANELSQMFKSDNSAFDVSRFRHACRPGSNVKAKTAHLKVA